MPKTEDSVTEEYALVNDIAKVMRKAEDVFRKSDSTRLWVSECFLPLLDEANLEIVRKDRNEKLEREEFIKAFICHWLAAWSIDNYNVYCRDGYLDFSIKEVEMIAEEAYGVTKKEY